MKQRVEEMEREANKLRELQAAAEKAEQSAGGEQVPMETEEDKAAADGRSIYIGNVCFGFYIHAVLKHTHSVKRWTIRLHPKKFNNTSRPVAPSTE